MKKMIDWRTSVMTLLICVAVMTGLFSVSANAPDIVPLKNVIFMIGDGMGPNQVAMARDSKGSDLHMQTMPYKGTISTSNIDGKVTDSAAAGTALACGEKNKKRLCRHEFERDFDSQSAGVFCRERQENWFDNNLRCDRRDTRSLWRP